MVSETIPEYEPRTQYDRQGGQIRLTRFSDGTVPAVPWPYSTNPNMSLGLDRHEIEVRPEMSDEELGKRIRQAFFNWEGRKALLDIHSYAPTSDD